MTEEKCEQLKRIGFFKKGDIAIYALVVLSVVLLFCFTLFGKKDNLTKIEIINLPDGFVLAEYDNVTKEIVSHSDRVEITSEEGRYLVRIATGEEFNLLLIEKSGKAYMLDADCSLRADCTHNMPITESGEVIICLPHKIEVRGLGEEKGSVVIG